jgi:hypothetical protein
VPFEAIAVVKCRVCGTTYVTNTIYCAECGAYLLEKEAEETDPIDLSQIPWVGRAQATQPREVDLPAAPPLTVRLIIGRGKRQRELEVSLIRPVRLGRSDPTQNIFPEVDLTPDLALEQAVSREHVSVFGRGEDVMVEDLGSTNGTLLNGIRLDPYMPETLKDGDQLQLGKLLIEVKLR